MRAISYQQYGSPKNLKLTEVEKPIPRQNEVLVRVRAASINSWDWDLLRGKPFIVRLLGGLFKPKCPILGADVAGEVVSVGRQVKDFKVGDEVYGDVAEAGFGGFAECVSVPEKFLARKPSGISFEHAAAIPQAGLLALQGLRYGNGMRRGHHLLINGAGGGVGTLALQYAKQLGATVTCVDLPEKFDMLRSLGADHLIDYTTTDYTRTGQTYDFILDVVAHRSIFEYRRALNPGGTFSMIGGAMGGGLLLQMLLIGPLLAVFTKKKLGLMGYRPLRADLDLLASLCVEGKIRSIIDKRYALEETPEAFEYFGTGKVQGKLVIVP